MNFDQSDKISPQSLWTCIAYLRSEAMTAGFPMTARFLETAGKILTDEVPSLKGLLIPDEPCDEMKSSILGLEPEPEELELDLERATEKEYARC